MPCCGGTCKLQPKIGPSILNADLSDLANVCDKLLVQGADYLHLDVMDGHFVPEITFGAGLVQSLRANLKARNRGGTFFDMHMMVERPEKYVESMMKAGADQYTFHVEATDAPGELCRKIREAGMRAGIAIKPNTSVQTIEPYVSMADMVLVMTVEPGYGGQAFISGMMDKVRFLRERHPKLELEVDGGVNLQNVDECAEAGANMIVAGTAVVKAPEPSVVMAKMKVAVHDGLLKHCPDRRH